MVGSPRLAAIGLAFASVFGLSGTVGAADVHDQGGGLKDAPAPVIGPRWEGFYIGGSAGYGGDEVLDNFIYLGLRDSGSLNGRIFGGHMGYNFQRGDVIFGIEAGMNGTNVDGETFDGEVKNKLDWYGTGVGRLGYVYGDLLIYGFAGFAWGKLKTDLEGFIKEESTHPGWTGGFGLERAVSDRFSVRLEYSHVDLGSESVFKDFSFFFLSFPFFSYEDKVSAQFNAVKLGISYKLGDEQALEPMR